MAGDELKTKTAVKVKPAAVKVFNCPKCGAGVIIRAQGFSVTAACGSCASIIDTANENFKLVQETFKKGERNQVIPLGQRGKLRGITWEVIGYMERCDATEVYVWSEYLLYNPMQGFRWLTETNGHWNYVIVTKTQPKPGIGGIQYMNKTYALFQQGKAKVNYVVGEFYWQVKVGESVDSEDYINPPEILSSERSGSEIIFSIGEYVEADEVKTAFNVSQLMPFQSGVAANQVAKLSTESNDIKKYWLIFIGLIILVQFLMIVLSKNRPVFSQKFEYQPADIVKTVNSNSFDLEDGNTNIEVTLMSPLQNNWLETQVDLVNDNNGETTEFETGVEYYSGYDSDGSWSEGSLQNSLILAGVPSGRYHLNIETKSGNSQSQEYNVFIKRDVLIWSNFFLAVILLSIFPLVLWWRSRSFEVERWSQSDFPQVKPFLQQDDE